MASAGQGPNLFLHLAGSLLLLGLALLPAGAQQTTGSIVGTVKDQEGAVVNTAKVKATNVDTGFTRMAPVNGYGEFRIDYLPVGKYTVQAEAASFERYVQKNLALDVDQTLSLDIKLVVGAQTDTVTVTEAPPQVNTSDAVLGRTIEPDEVIGLPLVNRNAYTELSLTPGVMANSSSVTQNPSGTPNFTVGLPSEDVQVNGSLDSGNGTVAFYLDGGNNITGMRNYGNPAPNPDAIEEIRVDTNAFAAEYGQFSGAVVSVITKSGTNQFHGSLFEFNRNTDFNAYTWSIPAPKFKAPYHRNNFGGTFGGPIKHDKSFFFFSYAGLRQIQGANGHRRYGAHGCRAPGRLYRGHDPDHPYLHAGHQACGREPGEWSKRRPRLPGSYPLLPPGIASRPLSLDPTAANLLNVNNKIGVSIPLPNGTQVTKTGGATYATIYNTPTDSDEYLGKYDESIGNKDHVGVTYFFIKTKSTPSGGGNVNWTGDQSAAAQTNANISDVHTFSPNPGQSNLAHVHAGHGRTQDDPCDRPGQPNPRAVSARTSSSRDRPHCPN